MNKGRLEAFSDGMIGIFITVMVIEMKVHHIDTFDDLKPFLPTFLSYVLSFLYLGIYWNNHHHLFHACEKVTGAVLWANLHLLFWLSLIPFTTGLMGENEFSALPTALFGVALFGSGIAYWILVRVLLAVHGKQSFLAKALGRDFKGTLSLVIYAIAVPMAFASTAVAESLYVLVALIWLVPDRRIERTTANEPSTTHGKPKAH